MINRTNEEVQFKVGMRTHLMKIMKDASDIIDSLDEIEQCLLCDLESLHDEFDEMHAEASSFYLQSYMEEFTPGFAQFSLAIESLSKQKHGALIVIQRRDEVEDFIQRGTNLHAKISASLIESIFYPGNPLHDGALLVKENTLVSAANVLPLTSKKVSPSLGTRHRAAIGLSGMTDALVLVVSEETGKMSFAKEGVLYPLTVKEPEIRK
ncbi:sporulation-specific diadenylate cyclase CdaS [Bacillus sp. FSL W8-0920]|uniref:sporulation-specific diadenylate cyclase CdaS n=1 Tax=Bacillus TaxID=1386 RepID=UPI0022825C14|nr:sporulation-specific diadenylate cyclase CdaS [Bacillus pumilus]MCY7433955.1 sporulation-specific diadenylate cyclase CdaS [Bacillus pumilus]MDR0123367.1 sporulation-specific diadenylate cyclase CdaS [Bacillus pumilus]MED1526578.1 sporulation-specific diadenylate cyclase CdaS [Bacillus pumilus]